MAVNKLLFKTSDSLTLHLYPKALRTLLDLARDNFFTFMYEHTEAVFYKENIQTHFGIFSTTEQTKMSYEEARDVYDKSSFVNILESLDNKKYLTIFTNYEIIFNLDKRDLIEVLVYDFKLLLDIANLSYQDFVIHHGN